MSFLNKIKRSHTITVDNDLSTGLNPKLLILDEVLCPKAPPPLPA
jgi:hypothetical protein